MKYCSNCGSRRVEHATRTGEVGMRHECPDCGIVHFQNPNIVVGCIAIWQDRVLLCQRAIEPFQGLWTLPAGYLEFGETIEESARRETFEEAAARVCDLQLFAIYNLPTFGEVYMLYQSRLLAPTISPGEESLDVRLFHPTEIPWDSIAFPMVREALQEWLQPGRVSRPQLHMADFLWGPEGGLRIRRHCSHGAAATAVSM